MLKRGIYNDFDELVGTVEYDGNDYYNIFVDGLCSYDLLTFDEFWNLMDNLDLGVGSLE